MISPNMNTGKRTRNIERKRLPLKSLTSTSSVKFDLGPVATAFPAAPDGAESVGEAADLAVAEPAKHGNDREERKDEERNAG